MSTLRMSATELTNTDVDFVALVKRVTVTLYLIPVGEKRVK